MTMEDPPADEMVIHIENLHKRYGDTLAVSGVSFHVRAGQILGLVGPNGAGKTTIIRAACGIHPPTQGRISIAQWDIVKDPAKAKRHLAYVPDDPKLFNTLTVWEHLRFMAAAYNIKDDFEHRGEELLTQFELIEKRHTPAEELSRGMRQKLAICCAYLHEPQAMFFDEPLTGLDPRGIRTMKDSIRAQAKRGAAIVISSHLLSLVEDMCSDLLVLHRGQCLYFGPLGQLRAHAGPGMQDASLEDIFLHMTGDGASSPAESNDE